MNSNIEKPSVPVLCGSLSGQFSLHGLKPVFLAPRSTLVSRNQAAQRAQQRGRPTGRGSIPQRR